MKNIVTLPKLLAAEDGVFSNSVPAKNAYANWANTPAAEDGLPKLTYHLLAPSVRRLWKVREQLPGGPVIQRVLRLAAYAMPRELAGDVHPEAAAHLEKHLSLLSLRGMTQGGLEKEALLAVRGMVYWWLMQIDPQAESLSNVGAEKKMFPLHVARCVAIATDEEAREWCKRLEATSTMACTADDVDQQTLSGCLEAIRQCINHEIALKLKEEQVFAAAGFVETVTRAAAGQLPTALDHWPELDWPEEKAA